MVYTVVNSNGFTQGVFNSDIVALDYALMLVMEERQPFSVLENHDRKIATFGPVKRS